MATNSEQDDWDLLKAYVQTGSEAAFETIVHRYVDQVYAMALRRTEDMHLAQDITQAVFLCLVRKARSIPPGTILLGWLFNTTRFVAQTVLRAERRRAEREKVAMEDLVMTDSASGVNWEQISPHIDDALASLAEKDRNVLLLRYYQQSSIREVAEKMGSGEDAAEKRISRAVEKIRRFIERRGFRVSGSSLLLLLSSQIAVTAPTALTKTIIHACLSSQAALAAPAASALVQTTVKSMFLSSMVAPALIAIGVIIAAIPITAFLLAKGGEGAKTVFDLSRDFTLEPNSSGAWTFGWKSTPGGRFTPLKYKQLVTVRGGIPIESWQLARGKNPAIYHNGSTSVWYNGQGTFPPKAVWFHAGENGQQENFGVIRFTVPRGWDGFQRVQVAVEPHFYPPFAGDTDFHVVTNGVEAFGEFVPVDGRTGFTNTFSLARGDTIDFMIGRGADADVYASGLRIQAVVELRQQ